MLAWLLACAPVPPTPNIVLVSLDTLRADRVGALGGSGGLTPNLDRIAAEGVAFTQAYSQASTSAASHGAVLASRYPAELGVPRISAGLPRLPGVLGAYGYQTGAFVGGGPLTLESGLGDGFDVYHAADGFGSLHEALPPAIKWLDDRDPAKPFFLFVHGYDLHDPPLKPLPFGRVAPTGDPVVDLLPQHFVDGRVHPKRYAVADLVGTHLRPRGAAARAELAARPDAVPLADPALLDRARTVYDGATSYVDALVGVLMAMLAERELLGDTWVVIMSDHGESLGEDGFFGHTYGVSEATARVVLLMRPPGGAEGRVLPGFVQLIDVAPTLWEAVGCVPPAGARGTSLLSAIRGGPPPPRALVYTDGVRELSVASAKGRLTWAGVGSESEWADDLLEVAALAGPGFTWTGDLEPAEREAMRSALVAHLRGLALARPAGSMSPELREDLQKKGYF